MKRLLLAFAPFALATAAVVGVRAAQEQTEHFSRTLTANPGGTLRLKSFSGRVNITATDANEVVIEAVRRASRERLDRISLDVHRDGSTVWIDANHRDSIWWQARDNVVETDFDIKVPRRTNLDLSVFSAPVTVEGVEGTYHVHAFSSRIRLGDIEGPVKVHTFSGAVDIEAKGWVDGQDVDIDTFSGNVSMRVPDAARGLVTFNSFSGHLHSDLPLVLRSSHGSSLKGELGTNATGGGALRFKTFSGSVQMEINR
jgi:DUF4097 and DUF4098 domain-containing protein YvlB